MPSNREREIARVINNSYKPMLKWTLGPQALAALTGAHAGLTGSQMQVAWDQWLNSLQALQLPMEGEIRQSLKSMSGKIRPVNAQLGFNVLDAVSKQYAQEQAGLLIKAIETGQRQVVQSIISKAMSGELTVDTAARHLKGSIGLHPAWAKAVAKYGDRQFEKLLKDGAPMGKAAELAESQMERYRKRLVGKRAQNIARTEIATANNVGQFAAYEQAVNDGYAHPESRKEWAPGPGACGICAPLSGEVVLWNQPFSNGAMMPPGHPSCRCSTNLMAPEMKYRQVDHLNPNGDHNPMPPVSTGKAPAAIVNEPVNLDMPGPKLDPGATLQAPGMGNKPKELLRQDQMPVPLGEPLNTLDAARGVNPKWGDADHMYNCSNVATAVEMRRRGFNVQAAGLKEGRYDSEYVSNWWHGADGFPANKERFIDNSMFTEWIESQPEGARGYVTVQWKQGGGHVFNWEVLKGKVFYIDAQPNKDAPAITFRSWAKNVKRGGIGAIRMDDKIPNTNILQALTVE